MEFKKPMRKALSISFQQSALPPTTVGPTKSDDILPNPSSSKYQTNRLLILENWKLCFIYKLVHILLLAYLVGHVFLQTKSYQEYDLANTSVVVKVKGTLQRKRSDGEIQVWDSTDFVVPSQESNAFFITTNTIDDATQTPGHCGEDIFIGLGKSKVRCFQHAECEAGKRTKFGNGIMTGNCSFSTGTCEIFGWCPPQSDQIPESTIMTGFESISILVKNNIAFPKFDVKRRNILDSFDQNYLRDCRFHPVYAPVCPTFNFIEILAFANQTVTAMAAKGGIIGFYIDWDCDLDYTEENCVPKYSFRRLDNKKDKVASGWNFRQAVYHYDGKRIIQRDLFKYWGIRFVMMVNGKAGRFSYNRFFMNLGSTISLFGIASFVCELLVFCCDRSELLSKQKYKDLDVLRIKRRTLSNFSEWTRELNPRLRNSDSNLSRDLGGWVCVDRRRSSSLPMGIIDRVHVIPATPSITYQFDSDGDLFGSYTDDARSWV